MRFSGQGSPDTPWRERVEGPSRVPEALKIRNVLIVALTEPSDVTVSEAHMPVCMFSLHFWRALSRYVASP